MPSSFSGHSVPPSRGVKGIRVYRSCKKWVRSDKIFFAICRVLDLYSWCKPVSGTQHQAILQEIIYSLFSFSVFDQKVSPPANKPESHKTFLQMNHETAKKKFWSTCIELSFLRKYNLCWPFLYRFIVLSSHLNLSSTVIPRYLYECTISVLPYDVVRIGTMYT